MKDIGIGVIGLGRLGYVHAYNIARRIKRAELIAVCDMNGEIARETADEFGCKAYTQVEEMLDDRNIDAVCVVTPTAYHVEPVEAITKRGKPFFCEKPLASNMEDTIKLVKLIAESDSRCQIGFNRRFDPEYAEAKRIIESGELGKPVYFEGISRDPFPPPPWACDPLKGGGLFIDMLLHDFDIARHLMGDDIKSVYARETNMVVPAEGIERFADNVTANLVFSKGALGNCHASMHASYGYDIRTEIYCEKGSILLGSPVKLGITVAKAENGVCKPITFQPEGKMPHFMIRFEESYVREMEDFVDMVIENREPSVTEIDALEAFKVSAAAIESAGSGKEVFLSHGT